MNGVEINKERVESVAEVEAQQPEINVIEQTELAQLFEDFADTPMAKEIDGEIKRVTGIKQLFQLCPYFQDPKLTARFIRAHCELAAQKHVSLQDKPEKDSVEKGDNLDEQQHTLVNNSMISQPVAKQPELNIVRDNQDIVANNEVSKQPKQVADYGSTELSHAGDVQNDVSNHDAVTDKPELSSVVSELSEKQPITESDSSVVDISEKDELLIDVKSQPVEVIKIDAETDSGSDHELQAVKSTEQIEKVITLEHSEPATVVSVPFALANEVIDASVETFEQPVAIADDITKAIEPIQVHEDIETIEAVGASEIRDEIIDRNELTNEATVVELPATEFDAVSIEEDQTLSEIKQLHEILTHFSDQAENQPLEETEITPVESNNVTSEEIAQTDDTREQENGSALFVAETADSEEPIISEAIENHDDNHARLKALHHCLAAQLDELTAKELARHIEENTLPRQIEVTLQVFFEEVGTSDPELATRLYLEQYGVSGLLDTVHHPKLSNGPTKNLAARLAQFVTSLLHDVTPSSARLAA